ncbi:MAG TPA: hypothetical protein PKG95_13495 [Anaerolineaceae bacterium]|nr:hypothetical protein [Anaerolineaceae bacterium]
MIDRIRVNPDRIKPIKAMVRLDVLSPKMPVMMPTTPKIPPQQGTSEPQILRIPITSETMAVQVFSVGTGAEAMDGISTGAGGGMVGSKVIFNSLGKWNYDKQIIAQLNPVSSYRELPQK